MKLHLGEILSAKLSFLSFEQVIFETLDLIRISDPVAFIRKGSSSDGFSRVVIFTEEKAGHYKSSGLFHAMQVRPRFAQSMIIILLLLKIEFCNFMAILHLK